MKTVLVTGGAGFIGSNFIRYMLKAHPTYKLINLDSLNYAGNLENLKEVENNPNYQFIQEDITNQEKVKEIVKKHRPNIVVNFAAESHNDRAVLDPLIFLKTNVLGTQALLEASRLNNVERFHHISCYDKETRAFTKEGLKYFNELKVGDRVMSVNISNEKIEWKIIEEVIVQEYKGNMIKMKTKTTDFLVTPNHRMLVQNKKSKKLSYKNAEDLKKETINKLPKYYEWNGRLHKIIKDQSNKESFMYILGIFIGDGYICYQEKKIKNKSGLKKKEYIKHCRDSYGRFIKTGKIGYQDYTISRSWRIFLDIPHTDRCRKKCEDSLDNLSIKWTRHTRNSRFSRIYFNSKEYTKIFADCGKGAKNKKIPEWALDAPTNLLQPLLQGLLDSDGNGKSVFSTSSSKLAENYIELCVKLGLSPSMKKMYKTREIEGRKIGGYAYIISFGKEWRSIRREVIQEEAYAGKIWCLKVKDNKNFLIERNGKTAFCGNTCEVFGDLSLDSKRSFKETSSYKPRTPYNASKAAADHVVRAYFHTFNLPITISNTCNNYGPYQYPEKLIPLFTTNALEEKELPLFKSSQNKREWIHVLDNAKAIDLIIHKGKVGKSYNVGTAVEKSVEEIAEFILTTLNKPLSLKKYVKDRPGHDRRYLLDSSKIRKELKWSPEISFESGLKDTIEWYKNNLEWWQKIKSGNFKNYYQSYYAKLKNES